jgi:hypothetical protein
MQILRIPPYPLTITYDVPDASTNYVVRISEGTRNVNDLEQIVTSTAGSKVVLNLPEKFNLYDESYLLEIFTEVDEEADEIVVEDNLEIMRPYVDPKTLGTTASEIAEYTKWEGIARAIIDSQVPGGFYYERKWYEVVGNNNDFMPIWDRVYAISKVYENNRLVWDIDDEDGPALGDWNYLLTKDKTSIIKEWKDGQGEFIRLVGNPIGTPMGYSDSLDLYDSEDSPNTLSVIPGVTFPMGWNYLFAVLSGYKVVPYDIYDATNMLIEDLKCGKLDYHKRYISNYSTDQFKLQIDKSSFEGTGNILVDKIINKYITNVGKPGVL